MTASAASPIQRSVTICVCTFQRPHIERTLASLGKIDIPSDISIGVLVVDNDQSPSARDRVERAREGAAFPIAYVHAPAGNISVARNACLDGAIGRFLAFLDDDEVATPSWLKALVAQADATGAAAVLGPVRALYQPDAPGWMRDGDFHSTAPVFVSGTITTGYTCNVLIDRASPAVANLRFDIAKGRSGGEDTDYFHHVHTRGGQIAFAPDAWLEEDVPRSRATLKWLAKRRFRMGQTHGQIKGGFGVGGRAGRVAAVALAAAKVAACGLVTAGHALSPVKRRRSLLRGILHVGTISGLTGARPIEQYGGDTPAAEGSAHAA